MAHKDIKFDPVFAVALHVYTMARYAPLRYSDEQENSLPLPGNRDDWCVTD